MQKVRKVFVDLDGVLADWGNSAHEYLDIPYDRSGIRSSFNSLPKDRYRELVKHRLVEESFWSDLELFPWSRDLVEKLRKLDDTELYVLTGTFDFPGCYSGKLKWIKQNFPKLAHRIILLNGRVSKSLLVSDPRCILIDDKKDNCIDWVTAGGTAFYFKNMCCDYPYWGVYIEELIEKIKKT